LIRYRFLIVLHTDKVSPFSLGMLFKYRQEPYTKRAPGGMKKGNDTICGPQYFDEIVIVIDQSICTACTHQASSEGISVLMMVLIPLDYFIQ
jgi:hypothetical protein